MLSQGDAIDAGVDLLSLENWGPRSGMEKSIRGVLGEQDSSSQAVVAEVERVIALATAQWRDCESQDWYWSMVAREMPELQQMGSAERGARVPTAEEVASGNWTTRPPETPGSRTPSAAGSPAASSPPPATSAAAAAQHEFSAMSTRTTDPSWMLTAGRPRSGPMLGEFSLPGGIDAWVPYSAHFCKRLDRLGMGEQLETEDEANPRVIELVSHEHGQRGSPKIALQRAKAATGTAPARKREVRSYDPPRLSVADAVALHAVRAGQPGLLVRALRAGADPNFRGPSYDRGSLLHVAFASRSLSCARLLLEKYQASFRIRDVNCKTPLDLAREAADIPQAHQLFNEMKKRLKWQSESEQDLQQARDQSSSSVAQGASCLVGWRVDIGRDDGGPLVAAVVYGTKVKQRSFLGTDEIFLLVAEFKSGERGRWEPGQAGGVFGRSIAPVRKSPTDGSFCVSRERPFTASLLIEDRIWLRRRVTDRELMDACIACGLPEAQLDGILRRLPKSEAQKRQKYDFETAARLTLEHEVDRIVNGAPPAPPQTKADLLFDVAAEAKGWAVGSLEGIVESTLSLAYEEVKKTRATRDREQLRLLQTCQQRASTALRRGRDAMLAGSFDEAEQEFESALCDPDIVGNADNVNLLMAHRWDLQQWLAVALIRKHVANGDLAAAAQVLQTPRPFPRIGATLDVGGSDELSTQLTEAKADMGGGESGLFHDLFRSRASDIETWREVTRQRVGMDGMEHASYGLFGMIKRLIDGTDELLAGRAIEAQREFHEVLQTIEEWTNVLSPSPDGTRVVEMPNWDRIDARSDPDAQRVQLMLLNVSALKQRARKHGVAEATLDGADDAEKTKEAVVELILAAYASAEAKSSVEYRASKRKSRLRLPPYHRLDGKPGDYHEGMRRPHAILACMEVLPTLHSTTATLKRIAVFCAKGNALADTPYKDTDRRVMRCDAMQLPDFELCRCQHGSALLAYTWARALLRNVERVPMAGRLVDDLEAARGRIAQDLDSKVEAMRAELLSRTLVRSSMSAGVAAFKRGSAADAKAAFERAQASMERSSSSMLQPELTQLHRFLEKAAQEVLRQEKVKKFAVRALVELGDRQEPQYRDGGADRALEQCEQALKLETDDRTPEHQALQKLKAVCTCWSRAEAYFAQSRARRLIRGQDGPAAYDGKLEPQPEPEPMAATGPEPEPEPELYESSPRDLQRPSQLQQSTLDRQDGTLSLENYIVSESEAKLGAALRPTEGYLGARIELSEEAFSNLEQKQKIAQAEIDRKLLFDGLIREGEDNLAQRRATAALHGDTSTSTEERRGFTRALDVAVNDDERDVARECIDRATNELDRQKEVKRLFGDAMGALDANEISSAIQLCGQALTHEVGMTTRTGQTIEKLRKASIGTQEHSTLMLKLKTETGNGQSGTPEHRALHLLYVATTAWSKGDQALLDWKYEEGKVSYLECQAAQKAAGAIAPTAGYFGPKVQFSLAIGDSMVKCIDRAKAEILRATRLQQSLSTATARLTVRSASSALDEHDGRTEQLAKAPDEMAKVQQLKDAAAKEKELQLRVKQLHGDAIIALIRDDPGAAIECYVESIACEEQAGSSSPELDALRKMKTLCEAWREGNHALAEWRGTDATLAFRSCRNIAQDTRAIKPTPGYAPVDANGECLQQIMLGEAEDSLATRIKLAAREEERKRRFLQHIQDGEDLLKKHQATAALEAFVSANRVALNEDDTRPSDPPQVALDEWELRRQCTERADTELARQKRVKEPFLEALAALKRSPTQEDQVWNQDDQVELAVQRCADALRHEVCADAASHEPACTCLRSADKMTPEDMALKHMIKACEAWVVGDQLLANAEWAPALNGIKALESYRVARKNADKARNFADTRGYFGPNIALDEETDKLLNDRIRRAQTEVGRREAFLKHIKDGEVNLKHRSAPMAVKAFNEAREKVYNDSETGEIEDWCARAETELANQARVKEHFAETDSALEKNDPRTAIRCGDAALQCVEESSEQKPEHPESVALRHILDACKLWQRGNEHLANDPYMDGKLQEGAVPLNGKKALEAFESSKREADFAAAVKETPGYKGSRIRLGHGAREALSVQIQKAKAEIQRKRDLDTNLRVGREALATRDGCDRAARYLIRDARGGRKALEGLLSLQRRPSGPREADNSVVNTMRISSSSYLEAYKAAICNPERDAAMEAMGMRGACFLLQDLLRKERTAYKARADEALWYCEGASQMDDCVPLFERLRISTVAQDLADWEAPGTSRRMFSLNGSVRAAVAVAGTLHEEQSVSAPDSIPVDSQAELQDGIPEPEPEPELQREQSDTRTSAAKTVKVKSLFDLALAWAKAHKDDMDFDDPLPAEELVKWPGLPGGLEGTHSTGLCTKELDAAMRALCAWKPGSQFLTAQQATTNLQEALNKHQEMESGNKRIREYKPSVRSQRSELLESFSEDVEEQQPSAPVRLESLIEQRDRARRDYVERGEVYLVSEQRLEAQRTKQAALTAELCTSLLKVRRYRRQLQYNGVSMRVLQVAMADEEKGRIISGRLAVEFDARYGMFSTRIRDIEAANVTLTGTALTVKGVEGGDFSARYNGTSGNGMELSLRPWYEFKQPHDAEWRPCNLRPVEASRGATDSLHEARRDYRINEAMVDKAVAEILHAQGQERVRLRLILTYAAVEAGAINCLHEKLQAAATYEPGRTDILAVGTRKGYHRNKALRTTKDACQACWSLMTVVHKNPDDRHEVFANLAEAYEYMEEERRLHPFAKCLTLQLTHNERDYESKPELNAGEFWKIQEIPIFEAVDEVKVVFDAEETHMMAQPTFKRLTAWVADDPSTLRRCEAKCRAGVPTLDGRWAEGQHAVTRSNVTVNFAFTVEGGGKKVSLVCKSREERDLWINRIKKRAGLLNKAAHEELVENRAGLMWIRNNRQWESFPSSRPVVRHESEPEPEPEPLAIVDDHRETDSLAKIMSSAPAGGHHAAAQRVAQQAVDIYAQWKQLLDHSSAIQLTDETLLLLQQEIESIASDHDWREHRDTALRKLVSLQDRVAAAVRLERALREIEPMETLRAALWGIGASFPQLSNAEIQSTYERYMAARNAVGQQRNGVQDHVEVSQATSNADAYLQKLRRLGTEASANRQQRRESREPEHYGMVALAMIVREDLREEFKRASGILAISRERQMTEELARCRPYVDARPPDTSAIKELQRVRYECTVEFSDAGHQLFQAKRKIEFFEETNKRGTPINPELIEERRRCKQEVDACRRKRREASKVVDAEMRRLAGLGSEHWPEIFHEIQALTALRDMEFLRSDDIGIDDYDYITPIKERNRNKVYFASIDGRECFLKAYDLTGTTAIAVEEELKILHKLRHPNIVAIEAVFEHEDQRTKYMYVQMPRYRGDFEEWLLQHEKDGVPPNQLRRLLLGVLRAVARVHERELTHNDIKLENILITREGDAVLSDFELCREGRDKDSLLTVNTAETIVGGTGYCMAAERMTPEGKRRPTEASDMYSVGVVMLLSFFPSKIEEIKQKTHPAPKQLLQKVAQRLPDKHIGDILECLLSSRPEKRQSARKILDDEDASSYFRHADADLPVYWQRSDPIVEITDAATKARVCDALQPASPDEFGLGLDQGKGWRDIGFRPSGSRDKYGRKRLAHAAGKPGIEVHKVWRVQNQKVWKQYAAGRERVAESIVRGPALDALPGAAHSPTSARGYLHAKLKRLGSTVQVVLQCLVIKAAVKDELRKAQDFTRGAVVELRHSGGTVVQGTVLEDDGAEIKLDVQLPGDARPSSKWVRASELTVMQDLQVIVKANGAVQRSSNVSAHAIDEIRWNGSSGEVLTFDLGSQSLESCSVEVVVTPRNLSSSAEVAPRPIGVSSFPLEKFDIDAAHSEVAAVGLDALVVRRPLGLAAVQGFERSNSDRVRLNVNEAFLLHGVPKGTLHKVLTNGLNERFSGGNMGSLFGEGTYLAEDIEKADQYADPDTSWDGSGPLKYLHELLYPRGAADHPGDVCYALICRTSLGYPIRTEARALDANGKPTRQCVALDGKEASSTRCVFVTESARELVALPETEERQPIHHHSLIVEKGGEVHRFREIVMMHGDYIYPEYVVAYRRVPRLVGGGPGAHLAAGTGSALAYPPRLRSQPATMDGAVQQPQERRRGQEPEPEPELVDGTPLVEPAPAPEPQQARYVPAASSVRAGLRLPPSGSAPHRSAREGGGR
jgi:serine/threonine protein kinase